MLCLKVTQKPQFSLKIYYPIINCIAWNFCLSFFFILACRLTSCDKLRF